MHLKESNGFIGLYTERPYKKGELLFELRGPIKADATSTSIQISKAKHIEDAYTQYINHHCTPSAKIVGRKVMAQHDLKPNDEITFDKNIMADELQKPFVCKCCGKLLRGKKYPAT
ncbi:SET domain-containing protein [Microscilla marina]|uniref:Nuclear protein SET, putative n=1 Tax=Microscilla marina ATCC 23134 TaxID=313606 RepID=A1ZWU6_MICM2|nr:hypothetical protein [Microscilla marina]EAY25123.1 nuclear protein SET, putative [Microscilla marina ATCC 23134]